MLEIRTDIHESEWDALVDLYDETNMFLDLGRASEIDKIRRAYQKSFRFAIAWDSGNVVGAGRMISDGECYAWGSVQYLSHIRG